MRLINVHNYEIREFYEGGIPQYAILSHTWGEPEDEVTFQDMARLRQSSSEYPYSATIQATDIEIRRKPGMEKILFACQQAKKDSLEWAWVDTCCIDKTSSAELDESITSMYRWYEQSTECYAFLSDFPYPMVGDMFASRLRTSRWITRGWTLQELIAPREVTFFGKAWERLGTRSSYSKVIHHITGVPEQLLKCDPRSPSSDPCHYSAAQKMSWAAGRQCKKVEDVAYCLLGLFDIYMPLHYGEGSRAFVRLQEEIFRKTEDHSLFAWTGTAEDDLLDCQTVDSIFASSPLNFVKSGDIVTFHEKLGTPAQITTHGVKIHLPVERGMGSLAQTHPVSYGSPVLRAVLNCGWLARTTERRLNPKKLPTFCNEDQRAVLLLSEIKDRYRGLQKSGCYSRLATSQHLGVHDKMRFQDPSSYETIILNTTDNSFRTRETNTSLERPISSHSRFTLMYQTALATGDSQSCLPYHVHRAWKLQYETGRWEQRSFSLAKIEKFDGPYLQRMELRGRQLEPLEFWFGFEQRRPGVNMAHICVKTASKMSLPDRSSLSFIITRPGTSRTEDNATPCDVNLRVGSSLFTAKVYCVVDDMDDVVQLGVDFSVRPWITTSQHESGGMELVPVTSIPQSYTGIMSHGRKLSTATECVLETIRKRASSDMIDDDTQKRKRWDMKWYGRPMRRTGTAVIPRTSPISMKSKFVMHDPSTDANSSPLGQQLF